MTRDVPEWVGKNDNQAIPPMVRDRLYTRAKGKCAECGRSFDEKVRPAVDHIIALCNGGEHRERNLQMLCVSPCHAKKTKADVGEKATVYRKRMKDRGLTSPRQKIRSAGFRKAAPQRTASRPIERQT